LQARIIYATVRYTVALAGATVRNNRYSQNALAFQARCALLPGILALFAFSSLERNNFCAPRQGLKLS